MSDTDDNLDALRRRLLCRIERRYQTVTRQLALGPVQLRFTRIADPDRVLDEVAEEEDRRERTSKERKAGDDLHLPYWAELWDSAVGMAQYLARPEGAKLLRQGLVLDLGCGMGLSGTMAAALGARVVMADLEPPALLFAALNSLPWRSRVRTRRLNWRTDTLDDRFGLILGADILYERAQWDYLEPFWRRHLVEGGTVLLGEPGRQTGDLFLQWIGQRGWRMQLHEEPVTTRPRPVRLLLLERVG